MKGCDSTSGLAYYAEKPGTISIAFPQEWGSSSNDYQSPVHQSSCMGGPGTRYRSSVRSLLCPSLKNRTSSPLQVLNFRGLVRTAGTVLPVLPIPAFPTFLLSKILRKILKKKTSEFQFKRNLSENASENLS